MKLLLELRYTLPFPRVLQGFNLFVTCNVFTALIHSAFFNACKFSGVPLLTIPLISPCSSHYFVNLESQRKLYNVLFFS